MLNELEVKMDLWIKKNYNVILEGRHGVGKTEIIKKKFTEHQLNWLYFSASTMDPWVDFIGIPTEAQKDGLKYLDLLRPLPFATDSVNAIFLDEYNRSPEKIRNATMELIQFKSINGNKFNNLRFIWIAINPEDENEYDVYKLDPAQKDRFHIHYKVPYALNNEYFIKKYDEAGEVAIKWWNKLPEENRLLISPRRLDYLVDYALEGGDLKDMVDPSINHHSLSEQLHIGIYEDKLVKIYSTKDDDAARQFLCTENCYNATIGMILKDLNYIKYFADKIPKEKIAKLILEKENFSLLTYLSDNVDPQEYSSLISHLRNNTFISSLVKNKLSAWLFKSKESMIFDKQKLFLLVSEIDKNANSSLFLDHEQRIYLLEKIEEFLEKEAIISEKYYWAINALLKEIEALEPSLSASCGLLLDKMNKKSNKSTFLEKEFLIGYSKLIEF